MTLDELLLLSLPCLPPLDSGDVRENGSRTRAVLGKIAAHLEYLEYLNRGRVCEC